MLGNELTIVEKILIIKSERSLQANDVEQLAQKIDPYVTAYGKLKGLLIYTEFFPGWENFAAFLAHLKFFRGQYA